MERIRFFSENDLTYCSYIEEIINYINEGRVESATNLSDIIELQNIYQYLGKTEFFSEIIQKTNNDVNEFMRKIVSKIGRFMNDDRYNHFELFQEVEIMEQRNYFLLLENYKIYSKYKEELFLPVLQKINNIGMIFEFPRFCKAYKSTIRECLISNPINCEVIIEKSINGKSEMLLDMLLPEDIDLLLEAYIESKESNINILRRILYFSDKNKLKIKPEIKLQAKNKIKSIEERILQTGSVYSTDLCIKFDRNCEEEIATFKNNNIINIVIDIDWIKNNLDMSTLWNNFLYLFGFLDNNGRLPMVSLEFELGIIETVHLDRSTHMYLASSAFNLKQMITDGLLQSYIHILESNNVRLEEMIQWFFKEYIEREFEIRDFLMNSPSIFSSYREKCIIILPEIDRIIKQYKQIVDNGVVDNDLIQVTSHSPKFSNIGSLVEKKYVYSKKGDIEQIGTLLFSSQSSGCMYYIERINSKYTSLYELIINENIVMDDYAGWRSSNLNILFEYGIIAISEQGFIEILNHDLVDIIKEIYCNEVINYWRLAANKRLLIDKLIEQNELEYESTLLSRNEQDYFDYFLNNSKFTNGPSIRNNYLHGSNNPDEDKNKVYYFVILKLIVILVLKINDELCIKFDNIDSEV